MKVRAAAIAAFALSIALGTTGCGLMTYQATTAHYDPSDGVSAQVGDVSVRNVILISNGEKGATLLLAAVNHHDSPATVSVSVAGERTGLGSFTVDGNSSVSFGGDASSKAPVLETLKAEPGTLVKLYLQYGSAEGQTLQVPVLDGRLPEYKQFASTK
ncbi:MAG TPA: hypothetical protein VFU07_01545 [Candidatus Lumbricidophila sp.]|nr:hypothetical protein [Candidatus Lumbricidophila sp.]